MLTADARVPLHALPSTHAHISAQPALLSVALIESPPRYSLPPPDQRAALGGLLSPQIALEQLRLVAKRTRTRRPVRRSLLQLP